MPILPILIIAIPAAILIILYFAIQCALETRRVERDIKNRAKRNWLEVDEKGELIEMEKTEKV
jgi:hypothetical protein